MVGADLEGGENEQRNAQLAALKRNFLLGVDEERPDGNQVDESSRLGLYLDVPVCRWGFPILPHHRTVLRAPSKN